MKSSPLIEKQTLMIEEPTFQTHAPFWFCLFQTISFFLFQIIKCIYKMNNDMNIMSSMGGGDKKHMGDPGERVYTILSFSSARNASTDLGFRQSSV